MPMHHGFYRDNSYDEEEAVLLYLMLFFGCTACWILVLRPGIEPTPLAVKAQSPNHWTTREFLRLFYNS